MGPQGSVAPFLKASSPSKGAVSPVGNTAAVAQERKENSATEDGGEGETPTGGGACASPVGDSPASSSNGLGHHGEPAEPESKKDEEPRSGDEHGAEEENQNGRPARLLRAPRTPSQSERELHEAVHLPHAQWCEYCVRGRGRNKPHKHRSGKVEGNRQDQAWMSPSIHGRVK